MFPGLQIQNQIENRISNDFLYIVGFEIIVNILITARLRI